MSKKLQFRKAVSCCCCCWWCQRSPLIGFPKLIECYQILRTSGMETCTPIQNVRFQVNFGISSSGVNPIKLRKTVKSFCFKFDCLLIEKYFTSIIVKLQKIFSKVYRIGSSCIHLFKKCSAFIKKHFFGYQ